MSERSEDTSGAGVPSESLSLDTTIGFNTEVGIETTVDSSSSSGAKGLSDPSLGSTDSSWPPPVHAPIPARRLLELPPRPGPSLPPVEEYVPALLLPAAT